MAKAAGHFTNRSYRRVSSGRERTFLPPAKPAFVTQAYPRCYLLCRFQNIPLHCSVCFPGSAPGLPASLRLRWSYPPDGFSRILSRHRRRHSRPAIRLSHNRSPPTRTRCPPYPRQHRRKNQQTSQPLPMRLTRTRHRPSRPLRTSLRPGRQRASNPTRTLSKRRFTCSRRNPASLSP